MSSSVTIVLVGGERDGAELAMRSLPPEWHVPCLRPPALLTEPDDLTPEVQTFEVLRYRPVRAEDGRLSIDDSGRYRFQLS